MSTKNFTQKKAYEEIEYGYPKPLEEEEEYDFFKSLDEND